MNRLASPILTCLALACGGTAHAGLTLSFSPATIAPGGAATIDVLISSDTSDLLDSFGLVVRLQAGPGDRRLEFVPPPALPGTQDTDGQLADSAYLFSGDSASALFPPAGAISSEPNPNDTYRGGDGTLSGAGVAVTTTPTLLTRLRITSSIGDPPLGGDVFSIVIDTNDPGTFFKDPGFADISLTGAAPGTVTVVPEPSTLALGSIGLGLASLAWARGRLRSGPR